MSATLRNRRNHTNQEETSARVVEVDTDEEVEITRTTEQQRERNRAEKEKKKNSAKKHARYDGDEDDDDDDDDKFYISLSDVLRIVLTLIALSVGLSYYVTSGESYIWGFERQRPWWMRANGIKQFLKGPVNLTPSQLALYDGSDPSLPIYLAINGTIIDVSANPGIYGPGGGYHFFVGRDATRAFVTGCFQEDLTNDMTGVEEMYIPVEDDNDSHREMTLTFTEKNLRRERERREAREKVDAQVKHWLRFYAGHEKYFVVGKVVPEETTGAADGEQQGEGKKRRVLCEGAQRNRPLRSELNKKL